LFSSLTAFLERETSKRYRDQSLDAEADLSWCSYIATANDDTLLPPHIRDRFRVVRVEPPTLAHLPLLAMNVVSDIEKADGIEGFVEPLAPDELAVIGAAWKRQRFSMRALQKIVQATLDARAQYAMRH
ncbi:MAG: ATPase, partial [Beijerinckiaceae bacterium]|nr:ATPase [Beijerinckiaceae bacterium]